MPSCPLSLAIVNGVQDRYLGSGAGLSDSLRR
jgi:hypothetical protein